MVDAHQGSKHHFMLLYCGSCNWSLPMNAAQLGHCNECPGCGRHGLCFASSNDKAELRQLAKNSELTAPWLDEVAPVIFDECLHRVR